MRGVALCSDFALGGANAETSAIFAVKKSRKYRVGIEPRNTFRGDNYRTIDARVSRTFNLTEKIHMEALAEAFNLSNTLNVRFFNTAYGASDFCPAGGPTYCGSGPFYFEGSPNQSYGTPRAIFNPRQIQLAVRFTW